MKKKALTFAALSAALGASIPALLVLRMMADNNNNGELYDTVTGRWDIGYAIEVAAIVYVPAFLVILALAFCLTRLWSTNAGVS